MIKQAFVSLVQVDLWFFRLFVWMGSTHCLIVLPLGCPISVGGLLLQGLPLTMYFTKELLPRFNVASFCLELLQDVHNTKHRDSVLLISDVQAVS